MKWTNKSRSQGGIKMDSEKMTSLCKKSLGRGRHKCPPWIRSHPKEMRYLSILENINDNRK